MTPKLLGIKFKMLLGSMRSDQESRLRIPAFTALSAIFWVMLFIASRRVVTEALLIEPVGELLVQKLLSIAFLAFLGLLVFSNIVTVFSSFYLADELEFLMSKPIPKDSLFSARFVESLAQSSWVIFIFGLPIFIAAGVGVGAPALYYGALIGVLIPFVAIPTVIATLLGLMITNILAANRTRDAMLFLGIAGFVLLFVVIRAIRPERLLNPDSFESIGEMLDLLSTPTTAYLPSDWAMNILVPILYGRSAIDWWSLALLVTTPLAFYFVSAWLHRPFYYRGYSKAQEGRHGRSVITIVRDWIYRRTTTVRQTLDERLEAMEKGGSKAATPLRQLIRKDQKIFVRDASQWSQILVVVAIIVIYLVNYKYFEIAADERLLGDVGLYFFNLAACGFVVVALSGRFLFPAVSVEGRSFWLILQAPISLERFLVGKWLGGVLPVVIVGQGLIWASNLLVLQNVVYSVIASLVIFMITGGVAAMAIGLGAVYPQFHNPNAAKIASSFGAVIYMILGMFLVLAVLVGTFRVTLYMGSAFEGEASGTLRSFNYATTAFGLMLPPIAAALFIKLGAMSLRRRL